jgi:small GTP-binding protein
LRSELDKIKNEYLYLAVVGQFKRGKSTLINALIGSDILPTAILPLTSIITLIKYNEIIAAKVIFENDRETGIPLIELSNYITESANPSNIKKVKFVEVQYPSELLKNGIVLIDTPGIGSLFLHNTKSAESFIPKIDAAIFVLSVDPTITQTEYQFFKDVSSNIDRIIVVMNKIDLVDEKAKQEIVDYTRNIIGTSNNTHNYKTFPLSAKKALEAKQGIDKDLLLSCGIISLENELNGSIKTEKDSILQTNLLKKIDRFISLLYFSIELELNILKNPISTIEEKIKQFNNEKDKIINEKKATLYDFNGRIEELISELEDEMEDINKSQAVNLYNSVFVYLKSLKDMRKTELLSLTLAYLASIITSEFEQWRIDYESRLNQSYLEIVKVSSSNINGLIKKITDISIGLFNISSPLLMEALSFEKPSKFIYRVIDEPLFLEIDILKIFAYVLPRRLYLKMLLAKMKKEAKGKANVNSGKISSFYRVSILDSAFNFKYDVNDKIDQIIAYIDTTISEALIKRKLSKQELEPRIEKITQDLSLLNSTRLFENEYNG